MISIELIQQLETRVKKVVELVRNLRTENLTLIDRIAELESELYGIQRADSDKKNNEEQVEAGINGLFNMLAEIEGEPLHDTPSSISEPASDNPAPDNSEEVDPSVSSPSDPSLGNWQTFADPTASDKNKTEPNSEDSLEDTMVNIPPPSSGTPDETAENPDSKQEELDIY